MTTRKTGRKAASAAGSVMGLTRREFMEMHSAWWYGKQPVEYRNVGEFGKLAESAKCSAEWAWRFLSKRARSAAASALAQREK